MKNPHHRTNYQIGIVTALIAVIAVAAMIAFGGPADANRSSAVRATCVPARTWNAPVGQRPCHAVTRIHEDGSGTLRIGTARRAMALCTIPNVREKPRFFAMRCVRLPR